MSSPAHHTRSIQRRVVMTLLILTGLALLIAVPVVINDDLRLNLAHRTGLAPGEDAEQLADEDDGATLVVLPLGEYDGVGIERYRYQATFIGRPTQDGIALSNIETEQEVALPISSLDHVAADPEGQFVLFRGPSTEGGDEQAILVTTNDMSTETLDDSAATPDIDGDWDTPVWSKVTGTCDRVSPEERFIACFNNPDVASYLAGDWQIDVQVFGDYENSEPVYRGAGFRPFVGFAHDDTWLYFQNELGIWRIELPDRLLDQ